MQEIENILKKYGVGWGTLKKMGLYQLIGAYFDAYMSTNGGKKKSEEQKDKFANKMLDVMTCTLGQPLVIEKPEVFAEWCTKPKCLMLLPKEMVKQFGVKFSFKREEIKTILLIDSNFIISMIAEADKKEYRPSIDFIRESRSEEDKIKLLFNSLEEKEMFGKELIDFFEEVEKEIMNGGALGKLEKELKGFFLNLMDVPEYSRS